MRQSLGIAAAIAAVSVFATTLGITFPLFALILDRAGLSETMIGLNSAMAPLGILVSAPLIPIIAARVNAVLLAVSAALATAVLILVVAAIPDPVAWFALRFLLGVSINILWVQSETWINQLAPSHARGRIMGLYATVLTLGFATGPVLVGVIGTEGLAPFIAAALFAIGAVPVLVVARRHLPAFPAASKTGNVRAFASAAPVLLGIVFVVAVFDQTTLAMVPIYGLRIGLDESTAAFAVAVLVSGNVLAQLPIGWLADLMPRRILLTVLLAITLAASLALPMVGASLMLWPVLFVWGAAGYGTYTVALAELGSRFTGMALLAGNASFALMWGVGGITGPASAGIAMDIVGPVGLPLLLAAVIVVIMTATLRWPMVRRPDVAGSAA